MNVQEILASEPNKKNAAAAVKWLLSLTPDERMAALYHITHFGDWNKAVDKRPHPELYAQIEQDIKDDPDLIARSYKGCGYSKTDFKAATEKYGEWVTLNEEEKLKFLATVSDKS